MWGLGFRASGLRFRVSGLGFRVKSLGLGCGVQPCPKRGVSIDKRSPVGLSLTLEVNTKQTASAS